MKAFFYLRHLQFITDGHFRNFQQGEKGEPGKGAGQDQGECF